MKQNLIKIIGIILVLLVVVICITTMGNVSAVNPNSERIAELTYELSELEAHKNICLDNLPYKESVDNANGIHTYCELYDERMMAVQEEIENLKAWRPNELETVEEKSEDKKGVVACYRCSHYDADTDSCIEGDKRSRWCEANFPTDTLEEWDEDEWYPGQLNESGDAQVMPEIQASEEHERFKEMANAYGLNASMIRQVENHYGIKEGVILCITVAETSGGKRGAGGKNIGSVGSNDRGDRPTYALMEAGLEDIGKTLTNRYLGNIKTLGCLSNAGSCQSRDDNGKRYATSNGNRQRNMVACLSKIYGPINASEFSIRR